MKGLTLFVMMAVLPSATFAETAGQAEVRQEVERIFAPTPGPRPHPSQVITPLIRKYGRENVADIALQPLTAALKGTNNYFMQEQIAWALFELKDPRSVGPLVEFLRMEKFGDWGAEKTLIAIGEPAVVPLVEALPMILSGSPPIAPNASRTTLPRKARSNPNGFSSCRRARQG